MKAKKIPMRSCVVTKEKLPKQELLRIVKNTDNDIFIDVTGKANGRGAYIKKDVTVINKAEKSKILEKHLEIAIPEDIYNKLRELVEDK